MNPARARALYTLLWRLGLPLVAAYLLWRSLRQPEYRQHWAERFGGTGALPAPDDGGPVIWVHAVSVGETRAAQPLVEALAQAWPGCRFVLTHMTPTGRAVGRQLAAAQGGRLVQRYLPYELPGALSRFFEQTQPALGLIMETEVWPNVMHAAREAQVPMVLANARLSAKSQRKGRRFSVLLRPALAAFTRVLAQTARDAQRLRESGAKLVEVCGNTKFDITPPAKLLARGHVWRQALPRQVVLMAISREGEEQPLLDAWRELPEPRPLLVIVPRHPQRFDEVAALIERSDFSLQRRSAWVEKPPPEAAAADVWLGDSIGEMPTYYACADVALLGGSYAPLGGQNLIEAAACGCPLVMGPHTFNFEDAAQLAIEAGAAVRMPDIHGAVRRAVALANDPRRNDWVEAALAFAGSHRGATERMAQRIAMLLTGLDSA